MIILLVYYFIRAKKLMQIYEMNISAAKETVEERRNKPLENLKQKTEMTCKSHNARANTQSLTDKHHKVARDHNNLESR